MSRQSGDRHLPPPLATFRTGALKVLRARNKRHRALFALIPIAVALVLAFRPSGLRQQIAKAGEGQRPNIILIVLDTVRRDATGLVARDSLWADQTPTFDRLAAEGTSFPNAWTPAPWTVPAHASLFTGHLPTGHGCTSRTVRLTNQRRTLAEYLSTAGYATAAFYSNPWLTDRASGLLRGFAVNVEAPLAGPQELVSRDGDQGGAQTLANVGEWLPGRDHARPFFLFVNLLEAHLPYDPPADLRRARLSDLPDDDVVSTEWGHEYNARKHPHHRVDWSRVRRLYGADVQAADRWMGRILDLLRADGALENAVVMVTSDHGENLGDHGLMEHQFSVHETLLGVPLAVYAPAGVIPGDPFLAGRRDDPVMLTDLFATALDCAGVTPEAMSPHARSLLAGPSPLGAQRPVLAEYAGPVPGVMSKLRRMNRGLNTDRLELAYRTLRIGSLRLTSASNGTDRLYDLQADPTEQRDVGRERPEVAAEMRTTLDALLDREVAAAGEESELDSLTRRQLESLGYIR